MVVVHAMPVLPERLGAVPGLELQVLDAGCCGMSGVFGYEADHFELSVAMGERVLLPAVRGASAETVVLATGTSCRSQIHDLAARRALHPLEFLAARIELKDRSQRPDQPQLPDPGETPA